jgi:hypothetical protein
MQAGVIHDADVTVYVGNAQHLVSARKFFDFIDRRKFGLRGEFDEHNLATGYAKLQIPRGARDDKEYTGRLD